MSYKPCGSFYGYTVKILKLTFGYYQTNNNKGLESLKRNNNSGVQVFVTWEYTKQAVQEPQAFAFTVVNNKVSGEI